MYRRGHVRSPRYEQDPVALHYDVLYRLLRCNYNVEVTPWYICLYVGCAQEVHKVFVSENTKLTCYVPNTARMYVNIELYIQHLLYKEKCV